MCSGDTCSIAWGTGGRELTPTGGEGMGAEEEGSGAGIRGVGAGGEAQVGTLVGKAVGRCIAGGGI